MGLILNTLFILYFLNFFGNGDDVAVDFRQEKAYHEAKQLSNDEIIQVAQLSDMNRFKNILSHILVPRVVGSESHRKVREYIMESLKDLHWTVETQDSIQPTPLGKLPFVNIIGRLNPTASRYLVLACHYDSKHMREGEFFGATDSAVPCSMMIDLAHALASRLEPQRSSDLSLMFLFFDGEEAFVHWSDQDSLYGARSLASTWGKIKYAQLSPSTVNLDRIDLFVLLDLLGAPNPTFYSYHENTEKWYLEVVSAEKRLTNLEQLKKNKNQEYFLRRAYHFANIEDDHIPFLERDVPCLHIIPTPFPKVWHKLSDNLNAIDMDTVDNLNKIFRVFTLEYLQGGSRSKRDVLYYEDL